MKGYIYSLALSFTVLLTHQAYAQSQVGTSLYMLCNLSSQIVEKGKGTISTKTLASKTVNIPIANAEQGHFETRFDLKSKDKKEKVSGYVGFDIIGLDLFTEPLPPHSPLIDMTLKLYNGKNSYGASSVSRINTEMLDFTQDVEYSTQAGRSKTKIYHLTCDLIKDGE